MRRKHRRLRPEPKPQPLMERPELFPVYVYVPGPSEQERQLRGLAFFEGLQEAGMEVIIADPSPGSLAITIRPPWTIIYAPVLVANSTPNLAGLRSYSDGCPTPLVYIMDCHFPITSTTEIEVGPDLAANVMLLDAIPTMLKNLTLADAVTVPNADWATDLLAEHPDLPVFVLPDLKQDGDPQSIAAFGMRFTEIALTACNQRAAIIREHPGH